MDILVCPMCKSDLKLGIEKTDEEEIVTGFFQCLKCDMIYPIEDAIPNLLPPNQRG